MLEQNTKVYKLTAYTLDELWGEVRKLVGETEVDLYGIGEGREDWDNVRAEGEIHISYDGEFSVGCASVIRPEQYWE